MRGWLSGVAVALGVVIAGIGSAPAATAPSRRAAADWTRHVAVTPTGAFVMGNPRAPVKLIEYLSLTCSHCAAFSAEAMPALRRDYIAGGRVSLEMRHAVRDGFDLTAAMLARCNGPAGYFPAAERLFATQPEWLGRAANLRGTPAAAAIEAAGDPVERLTAMAQGAGLDRLMLSGALSATKMRSCLADKAAQARLAAMSDEAFNRRRIGGTPSFVINGVLQDGTSDWATLKQKLDIALR